MTSEAMVRHIVGAEGAQVLIDIVQGAWQDHINENQPRYHRSTRAAVVWDHMIKRSEIDFCAMDGVTRVERYERPIYVLRGMFMLRPKMHDRDSSTRNYQTKAQQDVAETGLFPDYALPNVVFGYKLDAAEAGVEQLMITSPSDTWLIDLDDLASGNLSATKPMLDIPDYDQHWRRIAPIGLRDAT